MTQVRDLANIRQRALLSSARHGDRHAREELLELDLPLVRRIAARYRGSGLPYDDLVQEGALGLLEAIETYNSERSRDFVGYAAFRVHRSICNALTEHARLVRLPKHVVERRRIVARESASLLAATGHSPSVEELATRTGLTTAAILEATTISEPTSLDQPVLPDGSPLETLIADESAADPEETAVQHDEAELVDEAVAHLPSRQRLVVERTFGFDAPAESIAQVAQELHVSQPRARTIVLDALSKLRDDLERMAFFSLHVLSSLQLWS